MPRKMFSFAVVLALVILTPGAVQALPAAAQPAPAGFFEQLREWAVSNLAPIFTKDGTGMDPNGRKQGGRPEGSRAPEAGAARLSSRAM